MAEICKRREQNKTNGEKKRRRKMKENQLPEHLIAWDPLLVHRSIFLLYNKSTQCLYRGYSIARVRSDISNS